MCKLTDKQAAFIDHYVLCRNLTEAAARAGYQGTRESLAKIGSENYRKVKIREEIDRRFKALTMSADEVIASLDEQARADIGVFFKVVEEWTFYPLPTDDILDAVEVEETDDNGEGRTRISFCVRRVSIDPDKLIDPRYSRLLHKVSDTPRGGLTIELYSKQRALEDLGKIYALFTDRVKVDDWRSEAIEAIRNGKLPYKVVADELGHDLATELFTGAGIPIEMGTSQETD